MALPHNIISRASILAAATAALALAGAAPARAGLWSTVGGDVGRSGTQPFDGGTAPYNLLWADRTSGVATSVVVSSAQPQDGLSPRVIFATRDGRVHLLDLYTGEALGDPEGTLVGRHANTDAFTGFGGTVNPVEVSADDQLGQAYLVFNDRFGPTEPNPDAVADEIAIAQVDERSGQLVQYVLLPKTAKQVISSSPVMTPPGAGGVRSLLFTTTDTPDSETHQQAAPAAHLWRVPVTNATSRAAVIDTSGAETQDLATLNPLASPSLLSGSDSSGSQPGALHLFATLSTRDPDKPLQSFRSDTFCPDPVLVGCAGTVAGPTSQRLDDHATADHYVFAQTPSIPLAASGIAPGLAGSDAGRAATVFVATYDPSADRTTVHRLVPSGNGATLVESARSAAFPGRPSPQLAVTQLGQAGGESAGKVLLTTAQNLYALDGGNLSVTWKLDPADALHPGDTGFATTSAAVAGDVVFAIRDNGRRLALHLEDGTPLRDQDFDTQADATATTRGLGAPAPTAAGVVLFASDKGIAAFDDRCGHRMLGTGGADAIQGTLAGEDVFAGAGDDEVDGLAGDDCLDGGSGKDTIGGDYGDDMISGGPGADALLGGPGNDTIDAGDDDDVVAGGEGDDAIAGDGGDDRLKGGAGDDAILGGVGDDRLYGDPGDDRLDGGPGDDRLDGGRGSDRLRGGAGRDLLIGGPGNDVLSAGPGAGTIAAGTGNDRIDSVNGRRDVVHCGAGRDVVLADRGDRLDGCERVTYRRVRTHG